jgi:diguanylate cyclase (GGDEF)-like protein
MRRIAAGAALLAVALLALGTVDTIVTGHPGATLGDPRHVAVFALATLLIVLHQVTAPAGHRVWSAFAAGALLSLVAKGLWAFGDGDATTARTAEIVYAFSYLAYGAGLSLFLRRRVGDALRTFSLDALGIAMYVLTIGAAVLLAPITRHSGQAQGIVVLHLLYPAADAAICSVIFGVSSFTGRRKGDQDRLLGAAFATMCAADLGYLAGLAGWVHGLTPWMYLLSELALLLIAAAAWARPSTAGALRVGGWWEATPTLSWTVAGGGVLVAAWAFHLPGAVVALACGTLVLAAVRGLRVVREVRDLVVVRAESLVDDLTGLANQRALFAELDLVTREQGSDGRCVSLLIFDLDGFHELTDTLGHEVAGQLLRAVGTRLEGVVCSTLARMEGDQFATVVEDRDPVTVAAELTAALAAPLSLEGIAVSVRPVVGYARFPRDAVTPTGLARRADVARRDAKARGLAVAAYDPERDGHSRERLALAADLRAALETRGGGGLWLAFQPQVALATGEVHGAEALLRWCHPTRGELSPAEVLPVAERSGRDARRRRPAGAHLGHAQALRGAARAAGRRGHRGRRHARPPPLPGRPGAHRRAGRADLDRRLRHRSVLARPAAPPPRRRAEDRPPLRQRHGRRPARRRDRSPRHRARRADGRARRGRGHRDRGRARDARRARLRRGAGLRHRAPRAGGRPVGLARARRGAGAHHAPQLRRLTGGAESRIDSPRAGRHSWPGLPMIRVLVVDDHPVLRAGLEAVLRAEPGFRCVGGAEDGTSMWRLLRRTRPDVVILDHRLGQEDGIELCRSLRTEPVPPAVLLYTADPGEALEREALAAGACGLVDKAVEVDVLFDAIRVAGRRPGGSEAAVA